MDVQRTQRAMTPELESREVVSELQTQAQYPNTQEDRQKVALDADDGVHASHADTVMTSLEPTTQSMANNDNAVEDIDTKTASGREDIASTEVEIEPIAGVSQSMDIAVTQDTVKEVSIIIEDAPNPAADVKVSNSKAYKVELKKVTPESTTALPSSKGFLTVGMPGVGKSVVKQTQESSKKSKTGTAQNDRYKSAETVADDDSEEDNENRKFSRTSKSKKSTSDKKNNKASHVSKYKKTTSDNNPEKPDLLASEGIKLSNIVWEPRRKTTGGGSAPRNHSRSSEPTGGNKRKRGRDEDSLPNKKIAIQGRYIARPKVCSSCIARVKTTTNLSQNRRSLPTNDYGLMDIDSLPAPAAPATLMDNASSSCTLGVLGLGAVDWDDDDL
jgi:hypothetical protein